MPFPHTLGQLLVDSKSKNSEGRYHLIDACPGDVFVRPCCYFRGAYGGPWISVNFYTLIILIKLYRSEPKYKPHSHWFVVSKCGLYQDSRLVHSFRLVGVACPVTCTAANCFFFSFRTTFLALHPVWRTLVWAGRCCLPVYVRGG